MRQRDRDKETTELVSIELIPKKYYKLLSKYINEYAIFASCSYSQQLVRSKEVYCKDSKKY